MRTMALLMLLWQAPVFGQGFIYTFSGLVTDVSQDAAGIIGARGIRVGDALSGSFLLDVSRSGTYTQNDGTIVAPQSGPHDTIQYRYYYDRLLSDLPIQKKDGGSRNGPTDAAAWNYAYENYGSAQRFSSMGILQGGSDNESFSIWKSDPLDATIGTWKIGDSFGANAWASDSQNRYSTLAGTMTLTGIYPVPEPATCVLLGCGLMLLFYQVRRRGVEHARERRTTSGTE